ncbi:hypothetical protein Tco_1301843 [Tanacetum coccineum]
MDCSLSHTIDEIKALVEKLINEDMVRQKSIAELAVQFDNACTPKDDLRKAYEKCNDIPQESRALIDAFLKQESDKDYEMHLAMSLVITIVGSLSLNACDWIKYHGTHNGYGFHESWQTYVESVFLKLAHIHCIPSDTIPKVQKSHIKRLLREKWKDFQREIRDGHGDDNGNDNGNGNGDGGGNCNENGLEGGNGNGKPNANVGGVVPAARECTYQDFLKCQPLIVKNGALTWWNSHKRTVGINAAYVMMWKALMKLMTEMVPEEEDQVEKFIGGLPDNIQGNVIGVEPTRL